jgi:curli biogenesis system outer membrane secretion channel CsgG
MMRKTPAINTVSAAAAFGLALLLGGCSTTSLGDGGSLAQGSAGESGNAQGAAAELERCGQPLGTVALDESDTHDYWWWQNTGIRSTIPMFRLLAAQSNCFTVVERGKAFDMLEQERRLSQSGELQQGSNVGGGQLAAADFVLRPEIVVSDTDAGGLGATVGGLANSFLGDYGGKIVSSVAGDVQFRDAQTLIYIVDVRSGVQKGIAEGSARTTDFGARVGLLGGLPGWGAIRGYTSTAQGKVVVASYLDAFNGLVGQLRTLPGG